MTAPVWKFLKVKNSVIGIPDSSLIRIMLLTDVDKAGANGLSFDILSDGDVKFDWSSTNRYRDDYYPYIEMTDEMWKRLKVNRRLFINYFLKE